MANSKGREIAHRKGSEIANRQESPQDERLSQQKDDYVNWLEIGSPQDYVNWLELGSPQDERLSQQKDTYVNWFKPETANKVELSPYEVRETWKWYNAECTTYLKYHLQHFPMLKSIKRLLLPAGYGKSVERFVKRGGMVIISDSDITLVWKTNSEFSAKLEFTSGGTWFHADDIREEIGLLIWFLSREAQSILGATAKSYGAAKVKFGARSIS